VVDLARRVPARPQRLHTFVERGDDGQELAGRQIAG
jgi:hypothetical protein